ncbi:hypothetical protein MAF45_05600 [Mesosutterella sp. OilRF-GAM-744-9]|uniref:Holin n=2 Tax=Mesosutterella TaxID=2494213 RepID=A0ABS9MRG9_9BURK|nr:MULTISPECIES: hypothetical protein [unclassified Mesosutterella]MCG5030919.1 hypothetical protein [Mesosutterella sp. oilRF-744-WT-GAM-9]MDL2059637.1 hypothetical protein [Mesosutterella sp. AGMB02718]
MHPWLDFKNYRNPLQFFIREALLAAAFVVLVILKPFLNSLVNSGMSEGFASIIVGVVGFLILLLMERVWKQFGPAGDGGKKRP